MPVSWDGSGVVTVGAACSKRKGNMARLKICPVNFQIVLLTLFVGRVMTSWAEVNVGTASASVSSRVSLSPRNRVQYTRTEEVNKNCPALTPREAQPGDPPFGGPYGLRQNLIQRLSIRDGDWEEADFGTTPIIPFYPRAESKLPVKTKLASFWVTDVANRQGQALQVKGTMQLIIVDGNRDGRMFTLRPYSKDASFKMDPGLSVLIIDVEGIYQQTENEDVVCMLGCTFLPSPDAGVHFPNVQNQLGTKKLEKNCDIMVQVNYPRTDNLTSQVVHGTIHSLVPSGGRYSFSPITFFSQSVIGTQRYEAASGDFVSKACADVSESDFAVSAYKASFEEFCTFQNAYLRFGELDIEPNWKCNSTIQNCQSIGPFSNYGELTPYVMDYNTSNVKIFVRREMSSPCHGVAFDEIPLSLTLQLVPAHESEGIGAQGSGLNGQTLVAEGYWSNRSNTLCMIACRVDAASGQTDNCNSRVILYIPSALSISSRNLFKGKISSLLAQDHPDSFFPLGFHAELDPKRSLPFNYSSALFYNYSRLDQARAILDIYEPTSNSGGMKTPWFKYPSLIGEEIGHYQSLGDDLTFYSSLQPSQGQIKWKDVRFDLLTMDEYFPFLWSNWVEYRPYPPARKNDTIVTKTNTKWTHRRQEARKYMNCSGTLEFFGAADNYYDKGYQPDRFIINTEGLYNPLDGKVYMVGCRSIKGTWQEIDDSSFDLVDGMDCEIDIVLKYPTTLSAWLLNPGVKVKVTSNRPVDDVFHFDEIETETLPILYKGQREKITLNKSIEGALSVLTLSLTVVCIISQLLYIGSHEQSTPYLSLSMLGAQAMGYAIPLITGAESLLARKFDYRQDQFLQGSGSVEMVIYVDKILTLVALLLFLRLFEKVWRERALLSDLGEAANLPKERHVVVICFMIHAVGFVSVMALHSRHSAATAKGVAAVEVIPFYDTANFSQTPLIASSYLDGARRGRLWQVSKEYTGLIEDLFLLPQVVGFSLWDVTGTPLRLSFLVGLTVLQIVPHVYDYLRSTRFAFYSSPIYANPSFDFYTDLGNMLIPALALFLAVLVYCQQRWKWFLRLPTRFLYQPLAAKRHETELVKTKGRSQLPPIPEDDE